MQWLICVIFVAAPASPVTSTKVITRSSMLDIMLRCSDDSLEAKKGFLLSEMKKELGDDTFDKSKQVFHNFFNKLITKSALFKKDLKALRESGIDWLNFEYKFEIINKTTTPKPQVDLSPGRGRPERDISIVNSRAKARRTKSIRGNHSIAELSAALEVAYNKQGYKRAAFLIKSIGKQPDQAVKYIKGLKLLQKENKNQDRLSNVEALAMYVEGDMTKRRYNVVKRYMRNRLPNYNMILEEKKKCYPSKDDTTITEQSAFYELKGLTDITVKRQIVASKIPPPPKGKGYLANWKYGMDGSSGLSNHNQKYAHRGA